MIFNRHTNLEGYHAPFSASSPSWLNYSENKLIDTYVALQAKERGTKLHEWAKQTIDLGIKQPKSQSTLYQYINDAIGFNMSTEVVLFYSERFFGTADAISFRNKELRIHDLKTGETPAKMQQLMIYTALFCLEYDVNPNTIFIELRIYQSNEVIVHNPQADEIEYIIEKIVKFNKALDKFDSEV